MGGGRLDDNPITTEGCSWNFRDGKSQSTLWRPPITVIGEIGLQVVDLKNHSPSLIRQPI